MFLTVIALLAVFGILIWKASSEDYSDFGKIEGEIDATVDSTLGKIKTFRIYAPEKAYVGEEISVTIVAVDDDGIAVTGYTGQVSIKSELLLLPERSRFLPGDVGRHQFKVLASDPGTEIIEVADLAAGVAAQSEPIIIEERPVE